MRPVYGDSVVLTGKGPNPCSLLCIYAHDRLDNYLDYIRATISGSRRIFDNIQHFIVHLLATNIDVVVLLVFGLAYQGNGEFFLVVSSDGA